MLPNGHVVKFPFRFLYSANEYFSNMPLEVTPSLQICEDDEAPEYYDADSGIF